MGLPIVRFFVPGYPKSTQTGTVHRYGGRLMPTRMNTDWSDTCKDVATLAMREYGLKPFTGPVSLGISIIIPRLKNMKKAGPYPNGGPDMDNAIKGPKDAWQGVLYVKDKQVKRMHNFEVVWAAENIPEQARGGLAVSIYPLT